MKKLSLIVAILMVIGLASYACAEQSATGMNGKNFREQQVFIECYNARSTDISSNNVVILDTSATYVASGTTLGAYITTTTSADSPLAIGVTDENIVAGKSGRVCIRGPHKVYIPSLPSYASVGATLSTTTTAGGLSMATTSTNSGVIGTLLSATVIGGTRPTGDIVADGFTAGDGTLNYWVWVGAK